MRGSGHPGGLPLLRRLSDHTGHGDPGEPLQEAPAGRWPLPAVRGRDCSAGRRGRRLLGGDQGDDRHEWSGFLSHAGSDRFGGGRGGAVRHRECHEGRALLGPVHVHGPGRSVPGAVRLQRGLFLDLPGAVRRTGDVRLHDQGLQSGGALPDSRHHPLR